jgi:hypothetical protein
MAGPFKDMRYIDTSAGSSLYPKLLGCYEKELHDAIDWICEQKPGLIVDVGAAEGYYAVGMAYRLPEVNVIAFEMEETARVHLSKLAKINQVEHRIGIHGRCTPEALELSLASDLPSAMICDVEGYESTLLDPDRVPALRRAIVLVETHPHLAVGISDLLKRRFEATHELLTIASQERNEFDFDATVVGGKWLPLKYKRSLVIERGQSTPWILMKPKVIAT